MARRMVDGLTGQPLFFDESPLRLEPIARSAEVATGLSAQVHDPAWALTRQWQLGEFQGQDAGSPIIVELAGRSTLLSHWRTSADDLEPWIPYDPLAAPLDALVEAEAPAPPDERERVEGGAHLVRLLHEAGAGDAAADVTARHGFDPPLPADDGDTGLVALLAAQVPDAARVAAALDGGTLDLPGGAGAERAVEAWRAWWAALHPDPGPDTFDPHRFEHHASMSAGTIVVRAEEHTGDGLDWHSVDADPLAIPAEGAREIPFAREGIASPIRYGGLPADRFWEMEDAQVDLSSTDVSTLDTGRVLLIGFAEVYGNDWFLVPLEVPVGSYTALDRVLVTDTFGERSVIERAGASDPRWNLFTLTGDDRGGLLVLPTSTPLTGEPVEAVHLARDELANLAWAIEASYTDARGEPVDRRARWRPPPPADPSALAAYAVQTVVPDFWLPLVPTSVGLGAIRFDLVPLQQPGADSAPRGRLLTPGLWVHEEEVPREGAHVVRRPVLARWFDGSWHAWRRREKSAGSGESASGLAFDVVRPSEPWP